MTPEQIIIPGFFVAIGIIILSLLGMIINELIIKRFKKNSGTKVLFFGVLTWGFIALFCYSFISNMSFH